MLQKRQRCERPFDRYASYRVACEIILSFSRASENYLTILYAIVTKHGTFTAGLDKPIIRIDDNEVSN